MEGMLTLWIPIVEITQIEAGGWNKYLYMVFTRHEGLRWLLDVSDNSLSASFGGRFTSFRQ
jgi:hypothetical protein